METITLKPYGYEVASPLDYDQTVARVKEVFKEQGFGVLTEIDVQRTLEEKLGEKMERYAILGMCNPPLAHRAIQSESMIGLLLPCNVVVREEGGKVFVAAQDPVSMMGMVGNPELAPIGTEASERIGNAMAQLG